MKRRSYFQLVATISLLASMPSYAAAQPSGGLARQPAATPSSTSSALATPARAKVGSPATLQTVGPGRASAATGKPSSSTALDAAKAALTQRGVDPDGLAGNEEKDETYKIANMMRTAYAMDLAHEARQWPGKTAPFDPMNLSGFLTLPDGTKVPLGQTPLDACRLQPSIAPGSASTVSSGQFRMHPNDPSIATEAQQMRDRGNESYRLISDGNQLTLYSAFSTPGGQIIVGPPLNFAVAGATQTVGLEGGGSLTVTLTKAGPAPAKIIRVAPRG